VGRRGAGGGGGGIFGFGLWPAALELWRIAPNDPKANQWETARWKNGQLVMPGLPPLALPAVAAKAHARNGVTGAMAMASIAGHGHKRPSRWPGRHGRPTSMRWRCAGARANMFASIVPT